MAFHRSVKLGLALLGVAGLAAILVLWSYREPIAQDAIDRYLAERGVEASYEIKAIETRRQRLENVRIGPTDRPDLIADWVEIDVGPTLSGLSIKAVRAGGARIRARYDDGKFSMGALDRLLPPPSDTRFRLPDVDVSLEDSRLRFDSPAGQIGVRLDGQGNLRAGFEGKIAAVAPKLSQSGCRMENVKLYGDVFVVGARPTFEGPIRWSAAACPGGTTQIAHAMLKASLSEDGRDWRGVLKAMVPQLAARGVAVREADASLDFRGDARKTEARFALNAGALVSAGSQAQRARFSGKMTLGRRGVLIDGRGQIGRLLPGPALTGIAVTLQNQKTAAVIGPLAGQLGTSLMQVSSGIRGRAGFTLSHVDGETSLALSDIALVSESGASFLLPGRDSLVLENGQVSLAGVARFGGGGLPAGRAAFAGQNGRILFAPYLVRGGRLALAPTSVRIEKSGVGIETVAVIDGPVGGGRLYGLSIPLRWESASGLASGCQPTRIRAFVMDDVKIGPARFQTCVTPAAFDIGATQFAGRMDRSALRMGFERARYGRRDGRFALDGLFVKIAGADAPTDVRLTRLEGAAEAGALRGKMSGLSGQLAAIPIRAFEGAGQWSFAKGALQFDGAMGIADAERDLRFYPLRVDGIRLQVAHGAMIATGELKEPRSGRPVSHLALRHDISARRGSLKLAVDQLSFGRTLQPEAITPITLGVVANVNGRISGEGQIDWTPQGVTSGGRFHSPGLDFAAAFGPVTGLKGEIVFTDLLGFVTAPSQTLDIAGINPGIFVADGTITYRVRPGFKLDVQGGEWPFAGGLLILEPTVLDMAQAAQRRLTFRVDALDAARFIAAMEFENISATGTFNGVLPMVFDASGGRIEKGRLVAQGGGTVSYVGQVSNENLGLLGSFAFDALKSLRYTRLAIDLDGALDGDVITRINFAGVNQAPISGERTKLPVKILGASNLPFIFNVTVTAKFRQLFEMARSFADPSGRIEDWLKVNGQAAPKPAEASVQPSDSEEER